MAEGGDTSSPARARRRSFDRVGLVLADPLLGHLERYLQTERRLAGEALADAPPRFCSQRCADIDTLLCRLAMDGEDVSCQLAETLAALLAGAALDPSDLSAGWCQETAAALHTLDDLEDRLVTYVQAYWREERRVFGFTDFEATEPPEAWFEGPEPAASAAGLIESPASAAGLIESPAAVASPRRESSDRGQAPARAGGAAAELDRDRFATELDRDRFATELEREVARGHRGLGRVSVVLLEAPGGGAGIDRWVCEQLRPYDACCRLDAGSLGLILPGTDGGSCAAVVARLRRSLERAVEGADVAVGAATWPDDGVSAQALLDQARAAIDRDHRRHDSGEVEFDSVPPFMAEATPANGPTTRSATLWIDGLPGALRVEAASTDRGVRLRAPLSFLQAGAWVRLQTNGGPAISGRLAAASMGRRSDTEPPVLQLDVRPPRAQPWKVR